MEEDHRSQGGDTAWPIPRAGERPQDTAELPSALNLRAQREFPETRAPLRQAFAGPPSGPFPVLDPSLNQVHQASPQL